MPPGKSSRKSLEINVLTEGTTLIITIWAPPKGPGYPLNLCRYNNLLYIKISRAAKDTATTPGADWDRYHNCLAEITDKNNCVNKSNHQPQNQTI